MKSGLIIVVLSCVALSCAQSTLNCRFLRTRIVDTTDYICMLLRVTIDASAEDFIIIGEHESGKADDKMRRILITDSKVSVLTKALMDNFYDKFPRIENFEVFNSPLQNIEPGAFVHAGANNTKKILMVFNNLMDCVVWNILKLRTVTLSIFRKGPSVSFKMSKNFL